MFVCITTNAVCSYFVNFTQVYNPHPMSPIIVAEFITMKMCAFQYTNEAPTTL